MVVVAGEFHDDVVCAQEVLGRDVALGIAVRMALAVTVCVALGITMSMLRAVRKSRRAGRAHGHLVRLGWTALRALVFILAPVGGVMCLEFAVFHHALQDAGVEEFCLLDQALDHFLRGGLRFLLDEGDHGDVAFDLNILAQVEALWWRAESEFLGDWGFAGLVAANLPFVAQVDAGGGVGVCLQAPGHVVEASVEFDCAAAQFPDSLDVLDLLCDFVPRRIELVGGRVSRGLDCLVARDQRVQLDNLAMALQHINRELARDEARDGCYARVGCFFRHHLADCDRVSSMFLVFWVRRKLKEGICQAEVGNYVADGRPPCRGYLGCISHAPSPPRDSARQAAAPRMMSETLGPYFSTRRTSIASLRNVCLCANGSSTRFRSSSRIALSTFLVSISECRKAVGPRPYS